MTNAFQPVIVLGRSSGGYVTVTGGSALPFNAILASSTNAASLFNTTNHRFTAPISGMYLISLHALTLNSATIDFSVFRNNVRINRFYTQSDRVVSGASYVYLNVNDFIDFRNSGSNHDVYFDTYDNLYTYASIAFAG